MTSLLTAICCIAVPLSITVVAQITSPSTMPLKLLGTGMPSPRIERLGPGTLIVAGSTGFLRLLKRFLLGEVLVGLFLVLPVGAFASSQAIAPGLSEVPFRVVAGHAIVSVTVNGAGPFDFILDNGCVTSIVDPEIAQRLTMPVVGQATLVSVSREAAVFVVMAKEIKLDGMAASNLEVMVDPLRGPKSIKPTIHGVLGEDFLQKFDFLLDNKEQRLVFEQEPGVLLSMMEGTRLDLQRQSSPEGRSPYTQLVVHGRSLELGGRDFAMQLDSGTDTTILFLRVNGTLFLNQHTGMATVIEDGRRQGAQLVRVPNFRVGKVSLTDMPLAIMDDRPDLPAGVDGALPTWLFHSIYFSHSGGFLILNPSKTKHPHPVEMAVMIGANVSRD
jgi:predicted aspartyl protease